MNPSVFFIYLHCVFSLLQILRARRHHIHIGKSFLYFTGIHHNYRVESPYIDIINFRLLMHSIKTKHAKTSLKTNEH